MEEEEYNYREVRLPSLIAVVGEPELGRETGERRRGRDIIIAIDHGPNTKHAFDWALVHLCRLADTIHLVHAVSGSFLTLLTPPLFFCLLLWKFIYLFFNIFSDLHNQVVYDITQGLMEKLAIEAFQVLMVSIFFSFLFFYELFWLLFKSYHFLYKNNC